MNGTATSAAIDIMREEIEAAAVESRKAYHALADAEKAERELRRKLRLLEKQAGLHNTTTTPPAEYTVYLWAINKQYTYGATTRAEAHEMADGWARSGGMTIPDHAACSLYAHNNPTSIPRR